MGIVGGGGGGAFVSLGDEGAWHMKNFRTSCPSPAEYEVPTTIVLQACSTGTLI